MAQALIQFLDQQYVELDGVEHKFFQGIIGIFGHGNVTGIGQALEQNREGLPFIQGRTSKAWLMQRLPSPSRRTDWQPTLARRLLVPGH